MMVEIVLFEKFFVIELYLKLFFYYCFIGLPPPGHFIALGEYKFASLLCYPLEFTL